MALIEATHRLINSHNFKFGAILPAVVTGVRAGERLKISASCSEHLEAARREGQARERNTTSRKVCPRPTDVGAANAKKGR
jgi:hypothetical protein